MKIIIINMHIEMIFLPQLRKFSLSRSRLFYFSISAAVTFKFTEKIFVLILLHSFINNSSLVLVYITII